MSKIKVYGFIALIVIFFSMGLSLQILIKTNKAKDAEITRVQSNNLQLMAENRQITSLTLTQKEITGKLSREVDNLAKQLKIKPKQIERIIYVDIITRDTIRVPVYVTVTGKGTWNISDSSKCFKWSGIASLTADSLRITRTGYEDFNSITQAFYRVRPHKFLCIKFGKWQYKQTIKSKCGLPTVRNIEFIK